jgi:hypothetical protein
MRIMSARIRPPIVVLPCLVFAVTLGACGNETRDEEAPQHASDARPLPDETPVEVRQPTPAERDSMVAAAVAEEEALNREAARDFEARRASMAGYAECMAQARDLPDAPRAQVEAACRRLPDAPR